MIIAHNMLALDAQRQYKINTDAKKKSTEKLSSGYKINRAADDAAGLTISEKMRLLIRGLNQGSSNIQDGISLVQIADGAMAEIHDMLHRMEELSIKAYNGTNTTADREAIQAEVSQLINEIDRIAESTEFNTKKILKGEKFETIKVTSEPEQVINSVPEWLSIDKPMTVHSSYTGTQDVNGIMLSSILGYDSINNTTYVQKYEYYGPATIDEATRDKYGITEDASGYKLDGLEVSHVGEWTPSIADNYSSKVDFSALADCTDVIDLYDKLIDLLGTSMGFSCGTCREQYFGISINGTVDGVKREVQYYDERYLESNSNTKITANSTFDLSTWEGFKSKDGETDISCFDKVKELSREINKKNSGYSESEKQAKTKDLAEEITQKIVEKLYEIMNGDIVSMDHFDRAIYDENSEPYAIYVYDYRDNGPMSPTRVMEVQTSTYIQYTGWENKQIPEGITLDIVCSGADDDIIPISLPSITSERLGIAGYNIAYYDEWEEIIGYTKKHEEKINSQEYKDAKRAYDIAMEEYEEKYRDYLDSAYEVKEMGWINSGHQSGFDANGEITSIPIRKWGEKTVTKYNEALRPTYPGMPEIMKDSPEEVIMKKYREYAPSNISILNHAVDLISSYRSYLGAKQNELEHALRNNQNKEENTTAAESRLRDTDMSLEMVNYTKLNILGQVSEAMIAQANQSKQGVMTILGS